MQSCLADRIQHLSIVLGVLLASGGSKAADYTWAGNASYSQWNTAHAIWWNGSTGVVWPNLSTDNAVFSSSSSQKTVSAVNGILVGNMTFTDTGYLLTGGTIWPGATITVSSSGHTATIQARLSKTATLAKAGNGILVLEPTGGNNSISTLSVRGGTLVHSGGTTTTSTTGTGADTQSGGILKVTGGTLSAPFRTINGNGSSGTLTVEGSGRLNTGVFRIAGSASATVLNLNAGGTIRATSLSMATPTYPSTLNFNGGVLESTGTGSDLVYFIGGENNGGAAYPNVVANILAGGLIVDDRGQTNLRIPQPLLGATGDGGFTKRGAGVVHLLGNNTFTGGSKLEAGTLNIDADARLGATPAAPATNLSFLASSTLQAGANVTLGANRTVAIAPGVTATFDPGANTLAIGGIVTGAAGSALNKVGAGTLTLDPGEGRTSQFDALKSTAGTLIIQSGTNLVAGSTVVNEYKLADTFHVAGGTLRVTGGLLKTTGTGWAQQNGALEIGGGTADFNSVSQLLNAYATAGHVTVSGSGVLDLSELRITQFSGTYENATVNVDAGGAIRLHRFFHDTASSTIRGQVNLNGGTLVAKSSRTDFLGSTHANWLQGVRFVVREGGAIIDSNGFEVYSMQPLHSGATVDGGLVKRGTGIFGLSSTNGYNGATTVEAGTLRLGIDAALPAANAVAVRTGATFDLNGKAQTLATLGGAGTVANGAALTVTGMIAPGDGGTVGTLTLADKPASLSGAALTVTVAADGGADCLAVQGDVDLTGVKLAVENAGALDSGERYAVASWTGSRDGALDESLLPRKWTVAYDDVNGTASLRYAWGTIITIQ